MGPPLAHRRRPGAGPFSFFLPLLGGRPLGLELGIHWPPWGTTTPPTTRPEPFSKLRSTGRDVPPGTLLCLPRRPRLGSFGDSGIGFFRSSVLGIWDCCLGIFPRGNRDPFGFPSGYIGLWAITQCLVDRSEVSLLSGAWVCPFGDNYQRSLQWYLVMPAEYP